MTTCLDAGLHQTDTPPLRIDMDITDPGIVYRKLADAVSIHTQEKDTDLHGRNRSQQAADQRAVRRLVSPVVQGLINQQQSHDVCG